MVKTRKTRKQKLETDMNRGKNTGRFDKQNKLQQTNKEHRYKHTGEDGRHLEGSADKHKEGEIDQVVTTLLKYTCRIIDALL